MVLVPSIPALAVPRARGKPTLESFHVYLPQRHCSPSLGRSHQRSSTHSCHTSEVERQAQRSPLSLRNLGTDSGIPGKACQ